MSSVVMRRRLGLGFSAAGAWVVVSHRLARRTKRPFMGRGNARRVASFHEGPLKRLKAMC
jgi:hypothetical protein